MTIQVGIGLAFVAMLCWGFGDFLIQKSTRKIGDWETLFFITLFGTVVLAPFVYRHLPALILDPDRTDLFILISSALVLTCAAILQIEGFKRGKLSVLEPLMSLEILSAALLAYFVLGDRITWMQISVIIILITGLFMVSFREKSFSKRFFMEKGVFIFILGALFMGVADFLLGWGTRVTDPLIANFVLNAVITIIAGSMLFMRGQGMRWLKDLTINRGRLLIMSIADNVAWVAYAFAMGIAPIAVVTGLSESAIIVAVLLGLFINKEKLQRHQKIGLVIAIASALALAVITAG